MRQLGLPLNHRTHKLRRIPRSSGTVWKSEWTVNSDTYVPLALLSTARNTLLETARVSTSDTMLISVRICTPETAVQPFYATVIASPENGCSAAWLGYWWARSVKSSTMFTRIQSAGWAMISTETNNHTSQNRQKTYPSRGNPDGPTNEPSVTADPADCAW